jgi:hypothetical protein
VGPHTHSGCMGGQREEQRLNLNGRSQCVTVSRCFNFPANIRKKQGAKRTGPQFTGGPGEARGPHVQGLEKFRFVFPKVGKNSVRSSRGWKKKFQSLETWPRRGGIAERCNAKGRNRRRRNRRPSIPRPRQGSRIRRSRVAAISAGGALR